MDAHPVKLSDMSKPELIAEVRRLRSIINTPLYEEFTAAVQNEAAHQSYHHEDSDADKQPQDWFWLIGYLSGKALRAHIDGDRDKALHHTVSSAAALLHWHTAVQRQLPAQAPQPKSHCHDTPPCWK